VKFGLKRQKVRGSWIEIKSQKYIHIISKFYTVAYYIAASAINIK